MADHHSFDVEIAKQYGIAEAILLDHFNYWITKNRANGRGFNDGLWWTYNTVQAYSELFPYISASKVRTALSHLEDEGLIVSGNYNKAKFDRTKWYALTEKGWALFGKSICDDEQLHLPEIANGTSQNSEPIPSTNQVPTNSKPRERGRFAPPTREEVEAYAREKGYNGFPADRFIAYYESNGWMVGRTKMKSWRAAMTNWWMREDKGKQQAQQPKIQVSEEIMAEWERENEAMRKRLGMI